MSEVNLAQALNQALDTALGSDERVILLGEDIALAPMAPPVHGNVWQRLRTLTGERYDADYMRGVEL